MAQSQLKFNPDGYIRTWEYSSNVACTHLCRLIARLDLPLFISETDAFEEYIPIIILDFVVFLGKQLLEILLSTLMIVVHGLLKV
jgi:hypothetical protein